MRNRTLPRLLLPIAALGSAAGVAAQDREPVVPPQRPALSVTPDRIELDLAAPTVLLVLEGDRLDRAREARLEVLRPPPGLCAGPCPWAPSAYERLRVELLPASGATRRQVRQVRQVRIGMEPATYGAAANHDIRAELVVSGPDLEIRAPVTLLVRLPDLHIEFVPGATTAVDLEAPRSVGLRVRNTGMDDAVFPPASLLVQLDDNTVIFRHHIDAGSGITVAAGGSWETTIEFPPPTQLDPVAVQSMSNVQYDAYVDPHRIVPEADDSDNAARITVPFWLVAPDPSAWPDLSIERIETVSRADLRSGYEFRITLLNTGHGDAQSATVVRGLCTRDGMPLSPPLGGDPYGTPTFAIVPPEAGAGNTSWRVDAR